MRLTWEPRLELSFVAAAGLVIGAGTSIYAGVKQKQQSDQIEKNNLYPTEAPPQAIQDNAQMAKENANVGLPSQIYANSLKEIQRNQAVAIRTAQSRRAGQGLIGPIVQGTDDAVDRLTARNQQAQVNNQGTLYRQNDILGKYQQDAFNWNSKNRYNQQYNYGQQLAGAAGANIVHGVDAAGNIIVRKLGSLAGTGGSTPPPDTNNVYQNIDSRSYSSPNDIQIA